MSAELSMISPDPADAEFEAELRSFMRAEIPRETRQTVMAHGRIGRDAQIAWQSKLVRAGYACPGWPSEHGGPGWTPMQRHIFDVVSAEEGAPPAIRFGEDMIAPILFEIGTKAQKTAWLPRIRTLDAWFCQGFSEPGAGSDLAALTSRAVPDGDGWVVNGAKIWTTSAHLANMIFCLLRTDPTAERKQAGISMFVFPMDLPGITVRPIRTIDGGAVFNEVIFDNVRIAGDALIGEANKGWEYARLLLGHERAGHARIGQSRRELARLKALAGSDMDIASIEIELRALEVSVLRHLNGDKRFARTGPNLLKLRGNEIQQRIARRLLDVMGPEGLAFAGDHSLPEAAGAPASNYLFSRSASILGGSDEIQRGILARALGM
ncbi:acyl-CoA dehydrogenase family protein [Marivita sp. S6314]|uniref:acyl-CoA dehydrogenase family protein n=1 Tax=Marivita sp. S6314 TaxID=2926406 RepID=UPI001FF2EA69|nr:acyl-CoA dehydrogenase family protein [Marivita sp. S6314]MCK0150881.1 acyl-CoA dehydrogenase family protein [Marivita sp. S6314]